MTDTIDTLLSTIKALSESIAELSPDDPLRNRLEADRNRLRADASAIAVQGRHPQSVEREIESIESRLTYIESLLIKEGYQERRGGANLQDPGAYSANINRLLTEQHADEIASLTEQLRSLRDRTESTDTP